MVLPALAARIGILSNKYATETAADYNARIPTHTFSAIDTSAAIPTIAEVVDGFFFCARST